MTVSARLANDLPEAATDDPGFVDMRSATPVRAGTYLYEGGDLVTGWHHHDLHQIEYALRGVAQVETAAARYLLPSQQAVWIPAGLSHRTTLNGVRSVSVFFESGMVDDTDGRAHVLAATPLLREMMSYATRWSIDRPVSDATADAFFDALALLMRDWIEHDTPLWLPTSVDPVIQAAMTYTQEHLAEATSATVAAAAGVSDRTLRRQFPALTDMTWSQYLHISRLLRSMALLTQPRRTVLDVATEVGYDSVSAFTRAFRRYTGENPSTYRRRATTEDARPQWASTGAAMPDLKQLMSGSWPVARRTFRADDICCPAPARRAASGDATFITCPDSSDLGRQSCQQPLAEDDHVRKTPELRH